MLRVPEPEGQAVVDEAALGVEPAVDDELAAPRACRMVRARSRGIVASGSILEGEGEVAGMFCLVVWARQSEGVDIVGAQPAVGPRAAEEVCLVADDGSCMVSAGERETGEVLEHGQPREVEKHKRFVIRY